MVENKYWQIWRNYVDLAQLDRVERTGLARAGIYACRPDGRTEDSRSESVAEHVYRALALFDQIAMYCPEEIRQMDASRWKRVLLYHEYGEAEIGDIPDDGRRDEAAKDRAELNAMMRFCELLPTDYGAVLLRDFIDFQNKTSRSAQLAYAVDKLDFVLGALIYELRGRFDSVYIKTTFAEGMSEQDRVYAQKIGSDHPIDVWSAHVLELVREFACAPTIVNILRAAVEDVRGEWFPWADVMLGSDWPYGGGSLNCK